MRKNKLLAGGLSICLAVSMLCTACGGDKVKKKSVKLETGDITENSIVMKVGEEGVKYSEVKNYCYLLKRQYEGNFSSQVWDYTVKEGETIGDQAKQEIINMLTQLKVIRENADAQNITLTNDETDEALQKAEELLESATEEEKEEYFLTVQGLSELYKDNILANKMFYIATDEADTEISDEEAKQVSIQFLEVMTNGTDQNGTQITMDEKTKTEALEKAKRLRREAKETTDFLEFARENSDSGVQELTIGRDTDQLEKTAVDAAFNLKQKELSEVVEGTEGYYIIYCTSAYNEDATYARKEEIIEERQTSMFKDKYADWLKKCDVSISEKFWNAFSL